MKKLIKNINLSTEYKKWYTLNKTKIYRSTNDPYYYDVFYELLIIQGGLCAYTEFRLIDESILNKIKKGFINGKYSIDFRPNIPAQIEHFSKKEKQISGWNWKNLFAVYADVNYKKNQLEAKFGIDIILKPDSSKYDPIKYLKYDKVEHIFFPNPKLTKKIYDKVFNMIIVLGLNNDFIKMHRREYLNSIIDLQYYLNKKQRINQFHTAYSLMKI